MFCSFSVFTIPPARDPQERQGLIQQGVTIFISQLKFNNLNAEKSHPNGDLNPGLVQSRHTLQEPHTNWDGIPFCILPYLTSVTSRGSKSMFCFHYPTRDPQARQSLIQQGVTIFISQLNDLNAEKIPAQRSVAILARFCTIQLNYSQLSKYNQQLNKSEQLLLLQETI